MYYMSSTKISRMSAKVPLNLRDSSRKVTMIENKRYASQYIKVICHVTLLSNRTQAKLQVLGERRFRNSFAVFNRDSSFHSFIHSTEEVQIYIDLHNNLHLLLLSKKYNFPF